MGRLVLLLLAQLSCSRDASKPDPVVLVHGLLGTPSSLRAWEGALAATRAVFVPSSNAGFDSLAPLPKQCLMLAHELNAWVAERNVTRVSLIGFSQGGLLARCLVENSMLTAQVTTLVTIAAPNAGVYYNACAICVPAAYAVNPWNYAEYVATNRFLAPLNNEGPERKQDRAHALSRLVAFVMVWSPVDGVLQPPETAKLQFYKEQHGELRLQPLADMPAYAGLELAEAPLVVLQTACTHAEFTSIGCMARPPVGLETSLLKVLEEYL